MYYDSSTDCLDSELTDRFCFAAVLQMILGLRGLLDLRSNRSKWKPSGIPATFGYLARRVLLFNMGLDALDTERKQSTFALDRISIYTPDI